MKASSDSTPHYLLEDWPSGEPRNRMEEGGGRRGGEERGVRSREESEGRRAGKEDRDGMDGRRKRCLGFRCGFSDKSKGLKPELSDLLHCACTLTLRIDTAY